MDGLRRFLLALGAFIGLWTLISFGGVMFDPIRAGLWTSSLMWSMLSALLVAPALLMATHAARSRRRQAKRAAARPDRETESHPEPSAGEEKPFVEDEEKAPLWPEPEEPTGGPPAEEQEMRESAARHPGRERPSEELS